MRLDNTIRRLRVGFGIEAGTGQSKDFVANAEAAIGVPGLGAGDHIAA